MKRVLSRQRDVMFVFCASPLTIDKRGDWGDSDNNVQTAPRGAFLKVQDGNVAHLVQPNEDMTAPRGWVVGSAPGLYDKMPIWITGTVLHSGATVLVPSKDAPTAEGMEYHIKEPSMICYNDLEGATNERANEADGWVQTMANLQKNYDLEGLGA